MTLLAICNSVLDECGFQNISSCIGNTSTVAKQLLRFCSKTGDDLYKMDPSWSSLVKEGSVTLVTGTQSYTLPSNFSYMVSDTQWNRNTKRTLNHPTSSSDWQYFKVWTSTSGLNLRSRIRDGKLEFQQTITSSLNGQQIFFEYISSFWVKNASIANPLVFTEGAKFVNDFDETVFDTELFNLGVLYRYMMRKGLDDFQYQEKEYEQLKRVMIGRSIGSKTIKFGQDNNRFYFNANVPDMDFPS